MLKCYHWHFIVAVIAVLFTPNYQPTCFEWWLCGNDFSLPVWVLICGAQVKVEILSQSTRKECFTLPIATLLNLAPKHQICVGAPVPRDLYQAISTRQCRYSSQLLKARPVDNQPLFLWSSAYCWRQPCQLRHEASINVRLQKLIWLSSKSPRFGDVFLAELNCSGLQ